MTLADKVLTLLMDTQGLIRASVSDDEWPYRLVYITLAQVEEFLDAGYELEDKRDDLEE